VLLVADGEKVQVGRPYVAGAKVRCAVVEERLGPKLIIYKYRRRKSSHVKRGHRQPLVRLRVEAIEV
jgi:large subunit ribosomal protein L21